MTRAEKRQKTQERFDLKVEELVEECQDKAYSDVHHQNRPVCASASVAGRQWSPKTGNFGFTLAMRRLGGWKRPTLPEHWQRNFKIFVDELSISAILQDMSKTIKFEKFSITLGKKVLVLRAATGKWQEGVVVEAHLAGLPSEPWAHIDFNGNLAWHPGEEVKD